MFIDTEMSSPFIGAGKSDPDSSPEELQSLSGSPVRKQRVKIQLLSRGKFRSCGSQRRESDFSHSGGDI